MMLRDLTMKQFHDPQDKRTEFNPDVGEGDLSRASGRLWRCEEEVICRGEGSFVEVQGTGSTWRRLGGVVCLCRGSVTWSVGGVLFREGGKGVSPETSYVEQRVCNSGVDEGAEA